jgi:hypothetical protein
MGIQHHRKPYLFLCLHTTAGGTIWSLSILIYLGVFFIPLAVPDCTGHGQVEAYSTWTLKDKRLAKLVVDEWG